MSVRVRIVATALAAAAGLFAVMASGSSGDSSSSRGTGVSEGGSGGAASGSTAPKGAEADVVITGCERDATLGDPVAHLTITNNSSKSSNYIITIAFDSADGTQQLDTGIASVNNLLPGQNTQQDANSLKSGVPDGFVCKVADVTRLAA